MVCSPRPLVPYSEFCHLPYSALFPQTVLLTLSLTTVHQNLCILIHRNLYTVFLSEQAALLLKIRQIKIKIQKFFTVERAVEKAILISIPHVLYNMWHSFMNCHKSDEELEQFLPSDAIYTCFVHRVFKGVFKLSCLSFLRCDRSR